MSAFPSNAPHLAHYLTVQEVAQVARCEHKTVRRAIGAGRLTAYRVAGRLLMREADARAWIEARPAVAAAPNLHSSPRSSMSARPNPHSHTGSVATLRAMERDTNAR